MAVSDESQIVIRNVAIGDAESLLGIYNDYVNNSVVTFEIESLAVDQMEERIAAANANNPWLVLELSGSVIAYAYICPWNSRAAYAQSKESTVYVHRDFTGCGYGEMIMKLLIQEARLKPIHSLIAGITLPNEASVALHEKLGFRSVGCFKEVGYKLDAYRDVGYWQLNLEEV